MRSVMDKYLYTLSQQVEGITQKIMLMSMPDGVDVTKISGGTQGFYGAPTTYSIDGKAFVEIYPAELVSSRNDDGTTTIRADVKYRRIHG